MKFLPLSDHNVHGFTASVGDRTVEVLRSYPGDWFCYALVAGKVCKSQSERKLSYFQAMKEARAFLNRELNWEVWP